jgi:putative transcriptional regulator
MSGLDDLETPSLLIAMPQVLDPFFSRAVVLLAAHEEGGEGGSLGFVVNRPSQLKVDEVLRELDIEWLGGSDAPAFVGGPVQPEVGTVLLSLDGLTGVEADGITQIAPGVGATQNILALRTLARRAPDHIRLLLGHAGWAPGQLMQELTRSDWLTAPVEESIVFSRDPKGAWSAALASLGIDPGALPSWTSGDGASN